MNLKQILDNEYKAFSNEQGLIMAADPLQIARTLQNPALMLACALFSYGNAKAIVKFLGSLNFDNLSANKGKIYRFQNSSDCDEIFKIILKLSEVDIEDIIINGAKQGKEFYIENGINALIKKIYELSGYRSAGLEFYFGKSFETSPKSPLKRYNMWLRWLVRTSDIDLGLFRRISPRELILPLDTHTHKVSLALGLCKRSQYDFKAAKEITERLKEFDSDDPIKYDFALYRLGQSGKIKELLKK
ncbi:TIGR02757 family protein [Campylobacter sp.]|uniref:TIGR02757 family protein n=1 Tax=Campylobacter sp. TaxID=205 RepID=UPI002AA6D88E|nr:TIGR02757 family protein [Campylobacter sp.]MCI6662093.1 TIGR02757 family protein [Campylobacter sp.]